MLTAITRCVDPSIIDCELEFVQRQVIDFDKAADQHRNYQLCLANLGIRVISLPAEPGLPDAVFVEDPAVILPETAVITTMGSDARRKEIEGLVSVIGQFRSLHWLRPPATLEGGDVMQVGSELFVGVSSRTNKSGVEQLSGLLTPFGYRIHPVPVHGCLHLKTGCCYLGDNVIIANRAWVNLEQLHNFTILDTPVEEPWAANVIVVQDKVIIPSHHPRLTSMLKNRSWTTVNVDVSELAKAEAGLTCMSLIFESEKPVPHT